MWNGRCGQTQLLPLVRPMNALIRTRPNLVNALKRSAFLFLFLAVPLIFLFKQSFMSDSFVF